MEDSFIEVGIRKTVIETHKVSPRDAFMMCIKEIRIHNNNTDPELDVFMQSEISHIMERVYTIKLTEIVKIDNIVSNILEDVTKLKPIEVYDKYPTIFNNCEFLHKRIITLVGAR